MSHSTVTWHPKVKDDAAGLYLNAYDRTPVTAAVNEIDVLLRRFPESKGRKLYAGQLDDEVMAALTERMNVIPEDIRYVAMGPVEAFYTCHPEDRQTRLWILRARKHPPGQQAS
jgi:hypothetical protein